MRNFKDSDIFIRMNGSNAITQKITNTLKAIDQKYIVNHLLDDTFKKLMRLHRDSLTMSAIKEINNKNILILALPIESRLPSGIPFVNANRKGKSCVIVDFSKHSTIEWGDNGEVVSIDVDASKLHATIIPALVAYKLLNDNTSVSATTSYHLAYLWAKTFNRILMTQRVFVNSEDRYEGFMYFAMRFFLTYYMQSPIGLVDKLTSDYIKGTKNSFITRVEAILAHKDIDIYKDWPTFAYYMFSNEITQIKSNTSVDMTVDQYIRLFTLSMGREVSYIALWSADYFFYCIFVAFSQVYLLNDRAWSSIVLDNDKAFEKLNTNIYKELQ